MLHLRQCLTVTGVAVAVLICSIVDVQAQTVFSAAGPDAASITAEVNNFRAALGSLNAPNPGLGPNLRGRREINWDAVGDAFSAPNNFPGNFLNAPVFPRARGAEFSTPGSAMMLSADDNNPTNTAMNYANINPSYANTFAFFSPQRLFSALDSVIVDVHFFIAGTSTPARTFGFGSIFSDVDMDNSTKMEYYDEQGNLLATVAVPAHAGSQTFSFAGAKFSQRIVSRVRIFSGNTPLGPNDDPSNGIDVVVMDDFIYGEPVPEPATMTALTVGLLGLTIRRRQR